MEIVSIVITLIALLATVVFGYLQIVVPFIKKEVRISKKFPYIESTEVSTKRRRKKKKKSGRRWLVPITAIAVVIIAVFLFRILLLQAAELPPKPIAVMQFKNLTGDEQYDYLCEAIPNLLITNLEQSERLQVMTWERMHDLLEQLDKEDLEIIDEETGFELCRMDEVNTIVTGSFTKMGDMFVTDIKILDVSSKKLLKTAQSKGSGVASILKVQVDDLSKDIAKNVSLFERTVAPTAMQVMDVTTSSMEAYNYYLRGRDDFEKWYLNDARKFLEKAIEIDSMFASAYLYLGSTCAWMNDNEAADKAIKKASALSRKATAKEKMYIEASYASWIDKDSDKRVRILKKIAKKWPFEKQVHIDLGTHYDHVDQYRNAIEEFSIVLTLDPNYGVAVYKIAYAYLAIGDYAKAMDYFKKYAAISPGDANPFDSMGDLYFRMGELDKAIRQYREAIFVKPDFHISYGKIAYIYALEENYIEVSRWIEKYITIAPSPGTKAGGFQQKAFYEYLLGNYDQALTDLDTAENMVNQAAYEGGLAAVNIVKALIYFEKEEFLLSRKYNDNWFQKSPGSANEVLYHLLMGYIEIKQNNLDSARTKLMAIHSLLPDVNVWYEEATLFCYHLLYAELLLAEDSLDESIEIFKQQPYFEVKYPPLLGYVVGIHIPFDRSVAARAHYKEGDLDSAIIEYEKIVDPDPNNRGLALIHPLWHYELAKLYEERGEKQKAIAEYEKFLDLWKNADDDLPEPHDARKRLAGLKIQK
jgi:tetratricopeptide (TPR) repeat protein